MSVVLLHIITTNFCFIIFQGKQQKGKPDVKTSVVAETNEANKEPLAEQTGEL